MKKKIVFGPICEWDVGHETRTFETPEACMAWLKDAVKACGIDDDFAELEAEGLVGFEEIELFVAEDAENTLAKLRTANRARQKEWPGYEQAANPLFRAVEFGGEAGELLDAVKKLTRAQEGIAGNKGYSLDDLRQAVMEEVGDVLISLDMLTDILGIDPYECVPMKFNKTTRKVGLTVFMGKDWDVETADGQSDQYSFDDLITDTRA